jgi:hypothetical protein
MSSFGVSLPVVALNNGFLGAVSRVGYPVIVARQVLPTTPNPISFGDPAVFVAGASDGDYAVQSVADFIVGGGTFTAAKFTGVAIREVKTNLSYLSLATIPANLIGTYAPGEIAEVLETGSICVKINNGTPFSQGPVYVRIAANVGIPAGVVGGFEAVADGANTVALTGVVFRTGNLDANGVAEITILNRVAA